MGTLTLLVGVKIYTVSLENNLALSVKLKTVLTQQKYMLMYMVMHIQDEANICNSLKLDTTWKQNQ